MSQRKFVIETLEDFCRRARAGEDVSFDFGFHTEMGTLMFTMKLHGDLSMGQIRPVLPGEAMNMDSKAKVSS